MEHLNLEKKINKIKQHIGYKYILPKTANFSKQVPELK